MKNTSRSQDASRLMYVASRASVPGRAEMWRSLRSLGWPIVSTWIDEAGPGETNDYEEFWERVECEIRSCAGIVLYAENSDFPLKGALIEAGMGIAMGKPVIVVLPDFTFDRHLRPVGSWVRHPKVRVIKHLEEAPFYLQEMLSQIGAATV